MLIATAPLHKNIGWEVYLEQIGSNKYKVYALPNALLAYQTEQVFSTIDDAKEYFDKITN